jgi:putative nucleotidyltransferase with HDIG domain
MQGVGLTSSLAEQPPRSLDAVVLQLVEVSTLPQIALSVIRIARDPATGVADLRAVVEGDPALSARVIRLVNSAAYGLRLPVTNLHQAISYLGFSQVRNLAMTASVCEAFRREEAGSTYSRRGLWQHLVSVGICARLVARRCRMSNFEDAFLAGLLHDIGIILEDQLMHARFRRMIGTLRNGTPLCESERGAFEFDHCTLGARAAEAWEFPPALQAAIRFHHGSGKYAGAGLEIVRCVEVANVICTIKGITSVGLPLLEPPLDALQALGFRQEDITVLAIDLDRDLESNQHLFDL